jgi:putative sigma-54 modulation protein
MVLRREANMRIVIRSSAAGSASIASLARRRLEFALRRFSGRVRSLSVRLTDINGPRGGVDKKCLIAARLERPRRVVVVEDVDADPAVVVSRATERVARAVSRAVQFDVDWRRRLRPDGIY